MTIQNCYANVGESNDQRTVWREDIIVKYNQEIKNK